LGTTFSFLGDEIYIKAGVDVPSRRHYGNYPQIEDGVGMVRSFLNAFERSFKRSGAETQIMTSTRTHRFAVKPHAGVDDPQAADRQPGTGNGSILTGEMFAPILRECVDSFNRLRGTRLNVLAVPNTYFGGDVAVAGLLTGRDYMNVRERIVGDFAIIPKHTIKSDEPIFLDGMTFEQLTHEMGVPIYPLDTPELLKFLST
jgi:NifB/MoaA-like Fe-S oxidoreductase